MCLLLLCPPPPSNGLPLPAALLTTARLEFDALRAHKTLSASARSLPLKVRAAEDLVVRSTPVQFVLCGRDGLLPSRRSNEITTFLSRLGGSNSGPRIGNLTCASSFCHLNLFTSRSFFNANTTLLICTSFANADSAVSAHE